MIEQIKITFTNLLNKAIDSLPAALGIIILFFVIAFVARFLRKITLKILEGVKFDELLEKSGLTDSLESIKITTKVSKIIASLVYYLFILIVIISAAEILGLTMISKILNDLFEYFPKLFVAIIIFVIGAFIGDKIRKSIFDTINSIGVYGAKIISNIVYYALMIMITITALNQAEIETTLITNNLLLIMGSVLLAFGIAYGFASREILTNILSSYYGKDRYLVGQTIKIGDVVGVIEKIDSIPVTLQLENKKVVIPCKRLIEEQIEILD